MRFQRLKLAGFKSFVEATELRIEPGLTGIVGPNGCGKSNLLEALRWVMGANSARAMRAEGMDDVIFGGSTARPSRNHAEVSLQIDNAERLAPDRFNDAAVIEVVRRISRGAGSSYRVNGVEARARDVQMLFADASTGANSPALVRQGQISELIAAKPANRRRILEEAAGVSGLHSRRHEATLRLNAAEANLSRLDDVASEIEAGLNRLKREARKAEQYRRLSAEIRTLQAASLHARWSQAASGVAAAEQALAETLAATAQTARAASEAEAASLRAAEALKPLREEEMVAAAVLQRLDIERERLARETALAEAEVARLKGEIERNGADAAREGQTLADAAGVLDRLGRELAQLDQTLDTAPERAPELERRVAEAAGRRAQADATVERLSAEAAAEAARRKAAQDGLAQARGVHAAAKARANEANARVERLRSALDQVRGEIASLPTGADQLAVEAAEDLRQALDALAFARQAVTTGEAARTEAARAETQAREAARRADDDLRRLKTEAQGLIQLAASAAGKTAYPAVLDGVRAEAGLEAAVAAAFGETLDAALDPRAPAFWTVQPTGQAHVAQAPAAWAEGMRPLVEAVQAPPELQARLARTWLVDKGHAPALQAGLGPGEALVSAQGDLWRWDGFVAHADAPKPAAKRLAQRARLLEVEQQLSGLAPSVQAALDDHRLAGGQLKAAEAALVQLRRQPDVAERAVAATRDAVQRHAREASRREARAQSLGEAEARSNADLDEAAAALERARAEASRLTDSLAAAEAEAAAVTSTGPSDDMAEARRASAAAREAEAKARTELDAERRAREGRLRRREALLRDQQDWGRRAEAARRRTDVLEGERTRLSQALDAARTAPAALAERQGRLAGELEAAKARRTQAARAMTQGETDAAAAERAARRCDEAAAAAREGRAAASARLDGARERLATAAQQVRETAGLEPHALAQAIAAEAVAIPADPTGLETHLRALERDRDALGGVNLRAEEEAAEQASRLGALRTERADLTNAISTLRRSIETLNAEGRERLLAAFEVISESFKALFQTLFEGGQAELRLAENDDPLEAGLEIYACPPGKRLAVMSLMSGGEQALTAMALIFAVFLANPAPVCVLDEVDAPLDDANVDRFCRMLDEMRRRTQTRFLAITHNPVTMSRMDRLFGVTMAERGVSRLVSVDLRQAEALAAE